MSVLNAWDLICFVMLFMSCVAFTGLLISYLTIDKHRTFYLCKSYTFSLCFKVYYMWALFLIFFGGGGLLS